jgi:hypothetical protein
MHLKSTCTVDPYQERGEGLEKIGDELCKKEAKESEKKRPCSKGNREQS